MCVGSYLGYNTAPFAGVQITPCKVLPEDSQMPIYEYQCTACGAELEKLQKISDPLLKDCPRCGKPALNKRVSAPSFRLKGTGWYETDFKTGKRRHGTEDSNPAPESGSGTGSGKQEKSEGNESASGQSGRASKKGEESGASTEKKGGSGSSASSHQENKQTKNHTGSAG